MSCGATGRCCRRGGPFRARDVEGRGGLRGPEADLEGTPGAGKRGAPLSRRQPAGRQDRGSSRAKPLRGAPLASPRPSRPGAGRARDWGAGDPGRRDDRRKPGPRPSTVGLSRGPRSPLAAVAPRPSPGDGWRNVGASSIFCTPAPSPSPPRRVRELSGSCRPLSPSEPAPQPRAVLPRGRPSHGGRGGREGRRRARGRFARGSHACAKCEVRGGARGPPGGGRGSTVALGAARLAPLKGAWCRGAPGKGRGARGGGPWRRQGLEGHPDRLPRGHAGSARRPCPPRKGGGLDPRAPRRPAVGTGWGAPRRRGRR